MERALKLITDLLNVIEDNRLQTDKKTIIIVLGQCLLPNGKPHRWLIERVNKAYGLLQEYKLDIRTTYFILSGSDVSNLEYQKQNNGKLPQPKHESEAKVMNNLLIDIHNKSNNDNNNHQFGSQILLEEQAMTTIQNFFYVFQMINALNWRNNIKKVFIVTSDFHMKRSKYNFDKMFFNQNQQIIGNSHNFDYQQQVHFTPSQTHWINEQEKFNKQAKEQKFYDMTHLQQQTISTAKKLWIIISSIQS